MTSPTARTLAYCKRQGWHAGVTEKWIPIQKSKAGGIRRDLFGVFDLVVVAPKDGNVMEGALLSHTILGVQACAGASHASRVSKVAAAPVLANWIRAGGIAEVWSWSKQGARGKRKTWKLRRERVEPLSWTEDAMGVPL